MVVVGNGAFGNVNYNLGNWGRTAKMPGGLEKSEEKIDVQTAVSNYANGKITLSKLLETLNKAGIRCEKNLNTYTFELDGKKHTIKSGNSVSTKAATTAERKEDKATIESLLSQFKNGTLSADDLVKQLKEIEIYAVVTKSGAQTKISIKYNGITHNGIFNKSSKISEIISLFTKGNMTVESIEKFMKAQKISYTTKTSGNNTVITFTVDGKKYEIKCNTAAAKSATDNVTVKTYSYDELKKYDTNLVNQYFEPVAKEGSTVKQYKLKDGKKYSDFLKATATKLANNPGVDTDRLSISGSWYSSKQCSKNASCKQSVITRAMEYFDSNLKNILKEDFNTEIVPFLKDMGYSSTVLDTVFEMYFSETRTSIQTRLTNNDNILIKSGYKGWLNNTGWAEIDAKTFVKEVAKTFNNKFSSFMKNVASKLGTVEEKIDSDKNVSKIIEYIEQVIKGTLSKEDFLKQLLLEGVFYTDDRTNGLVFEVNGKKYQIYNNKYKSNGKPVCYFSNSNSNQIRVSISDEKAASENIAAIERLLDSFKAGEILLKDLQGALNEKGLVASVTTKNNTTTVTISYNEQEYKAEFNLANKIEEIVQKFTQGNMIIKSVEEFLKAQNIKYSISKYSNYTEISFNDYKIKCNNDASNSAVDLKTVVTYTANNLKDYPQDIVNKYFEPVIKQKKNGVYKNQEYALRQGKTWQEFKSEIISLSLSKSGSLLDKSKLPGYSNGQTDELYYRKNYTKSDKCVDPVKNKALNYLDNNLKPTLKTAFEQKYKAALLAIGYTLDEIIQKFDEIYTKAKERIKTELENFMTSGYSRAGLNHGWARINATQLVDAFMATFDKSIENLNTELKVEAKYDFTNEAIISSLEKAGMLEETTKNNTFVQKRASEMGCFNTKLVDEFFDFKDGLYTLKEGKSYEQFIALHVTAAAIYVDCGEGLEIPAGGKFECYNENLEICKKNVTERIDGTFERAKETLKKNFTSTIAPLLKECGYTDYQVEQIFEQCFNVVLDKRNTIAQLTYNVETYRDNEGFLREWCYVGIQADALMNNIVSIFNQAVSQVLMGIATETEKERTVREKYGSEEALVSTTKEIYVAIERLNNEAFLNFLGNSNKVFNIDNLMDLYAEYHDLDMLTLGDIQVVTTLYANMLDTFCGSENEKELDKLINNKTKTFADLVNEKSSAQTKSSGARIQQMGVGITEDKGCLVIGTIVDGLCTGMQMMGGPIAVAGTVVSLINNIVCASATGDVNWGDLIGTCAVDLAFALVPGLAMARKLGNASKAIAKIMYHNKKACEYINFGVNTLQSALTVTVDGSHITPSIAGADTLVPASQINMYNSYMNYMQTHYSSEYSGGMSDYSYDNWVEDFAESFQYNEDGSFDPLTHFMTWYTVDGKTYLSESWEYMGQFFENIGGDYAGYGFGLAECWADTGKKHGQPHIVNGEMTGYYWLRDGDGNLFIGDKDGKPVPEYNKF